MSNIMKSIVKIENFPSRIEIFDLLNNYLSQNNLTNDYITNNKDNVISFIFKNSVKLF
jgi:hypothetical protein